MIYKFENYALDMKRRELRLGPELVPMEPQNFDLLQYLIESRDRVASKDDLILNVWKGRIVSDSTMSSSVAAVRQAIADTGESQRLIRTVPRKGFRFVGSVAEDDGQSADPPSLASPTPQVTVPDKPSIVVIPFANLSGDPEQDYFTDGISEDLITALSHFRWLFVIARNSSFRFKGQAIDIKQVANDLGVRYVLEGSVRKAGNRIRLTGLLIDANTGAQLWADHFDGTLEDIFDLQDRLTARVVGATGPKLEQAEMDRAKRKPPESLDAYDCYLRGMASVHQGTREASDDALRFFHKAIGLDPNYSAACGMAAWCYAWRRWDAYTQDLPAEAAIAEELALRATESKDDVIALCYGGYALAFFDHDLNGGAEFIKHAIALNPNLVASWYHRGWVSVFLGESDDAIAAFEQAMRLSPLDPLIFRAYAGTAYAHFLADRFQEAVIWSEKSVRQRRYYRPGVRLLAASNAMAGRQQESQRALEALLKLDPDLRVPQLKDLLPLRRPEHIAKFEEGMHKAGLPK